MCKSTLSAHDMLALLMIWHVIMVLAASNLQLNSAHVDDFCFCSSQCCTPSTGLHVPFSFTGLCGRCNAHCMQAGRLISLLMSS